MSFYLNVCGKGVWYDLKFEYQPPEFSIFYSFSKSGGLQIYIEQLFSSIFCASSSKDNNVIMIHC